MANHASELMRSRNRQRLRDLRNRKEDQGGNVPETREKKRIRLPFFQRKEQAPTTLRAKPIEAKQPDSKPLKKKDDWQSLEGQRAFKTAIATHTTALFGEELLKQNINPDSERGQIILKNIKAYIQTDLAEVRFKPVGLESRKVGFSGLVPVKMNYVGDKVMVPGSPRNQRDTSAMQEDARSMAKHYHQRYADEIFISNGRTYFLKQMDYKPASEIDYDKVVLKQQQKDLYAQFGDLIDAEIKAKDGPFIRLVGEVGTAAEKADLARVLKRGSINRGVDGLIGSSTRLTMNSAIYFSSINGTNPQVGPSDNIKGLQQQLLNSTPSGLADYFESVYLEDIRIFSGMNAEGRLSSSERAILRTKVGKSFKDFRTALKEMRPFIPSGNAQMIADKLQDAQKLVASKI